jgi:hypothetical protein
MEIEPLPSGQLNSDKLGRQGTATLIGDVIRPGSMPQEACDELI